MLKKPASALEPKPQPNIFHRILKDSAKEAVSETSAHYHAPGPLRLVPFARSPGINFRSHLLALVATAFQVIFAASALAQSIAYESFAGIHVGSGLAGSGSTATGRTDSGWANGSNPSFLVRPPTVGTGSDTLNLRSSNGTSSLALVALQPGLGHFNPQLLFNGGVGTGGGVLQALYTSTRISSSDTGGPTSSAIFDELRDWVYVGGCRASHVSHEFGKYLDARFGGDWRQCLDRRSSYYRPPRQ
jgi:hypothetical protein